MNKNVCVGISGLGIYLPQNIMTAGQIAKATGGLWSEESIVSKLGIVKKTIPGPEDGTQEMGVRAALDCLKDAKEDPENIDVILCFGEEWKEYPITTSALYIQDKIGAVNAWGIDIQNRCCTTIAAIKIAKDMLLSDDSIHNILLVGGYRNGDFVDYQDKDMSMMFNLAAGGGAILLKKNFEHNLVLGSHIIADGSLSRTAGVEIGGINNPITKDNVEKAYTSLKLMEPIKMKNRLNEVSSGNWMKCIQEAATKSGIKIQDIDYLAILHIKRSAHLGMLKDLGLKEDQTIYLEEYGHIGQVDQILSMKLARDEGKIKDGSIICTLAAGIGYVWAANIIRWG